MTSVAMLFPLEFRLFMHFHVKQIYKKTKNVSGSLNISSSRISYKEVAPSILCCPNGNFPLQNLGRFLQQSRATQPKLIINCMQGLLVFL